MPRYRVIIETPKSVISEYEVNASCEAVATGRAWRKYHMGEPASKPHEVATDPPTVMLTELIPEMPGAEEPAAS